MSKRGLPESIRMKHDLHYVDEFFQDESGAIGRYIPVDLIRPNPNQPRQALGDLSELVASIREKGVLEPLLVRRSGEGFQIIAGERRWRAAKEVGLSVVPCIEKDADEKEMLEIALIENLQRKDLTPFEEADALQALAEKFNYTHSQIAQVIGKSRTSVTETLALNQIPLEIKEMCRRADINNKSLLLQIVRQPDFIEMKKMAERIVREDLTRQQVRTEKEIHKGRSRRFQFVSKGQGFKLIIRFNKDKVPLETVRAALQETLAKLI